MAYWNARQLLQVNPDDNCCVGTAKIYSLPRRCRNTLTPKNRARAEALIDKMDSQRYVSTKDLEDLAATMLCREKHNNARKPHLSQVGEVRDRWYYVIKEHLQRLERERLEQEEEIDEHAFLYQEKTDFMRVRELVEIAAGLGTHQLFLDSRLKATRKMIERALFNAVTSVDPPENIDTDMPDRVQSSATADESRGTLHHTSRVPKQELRQKPSDRSIGKNFGAIVEDEPLNFPSQIQLLSPPPDSPSPTMESPRDYGDEKFMPMSFEIYSMPEIEEKIPVIDESDTVPLMTRVIAEKDSNDDFQMQARISTCSEIQGVSELFSPVSPLEQDTIAHMFSSFATAQPLLPTITESLEPEPQKTLPEFNFELVATSLPEAKAPSLAPSISQSSSPEPEKHDMRYTFGPPPFSASSNNTLSEKPSSIWGAADSQEPVPSPAPAIEAPSGVRSPTPPTVSPEDSPRYSEQSQDTRNISPLAFTTVESHMRPRPRSPPPTLLKPQGPPNRPHSLLYNTPTTPHGQDYGFAVIASSPRTYKTFLPNIDTGSGTESESKAEDSKDHAKDTKQPPSQPISPIQLRAGIRSMPPPIAPPRTSSIGSTSASTPTSPSKQMARTLEELRTEVLTRIECHQYPEEEEAGVEDADGLMKKLRNRVLFRKTMKV